jgi:hypothetical protein
VAVLRRRSKGPPPSTRELLSSSKTNELEREKTPRTVAKHLLF